MFRNEARLALVLAVATFVEVSCAVVVNVRSTPLAVALRGKRNRPGLVANKSGLLPYGAEAFKSVNAPDPDGDFIPDEVLRDDLTSEGKIADGKERWEAKHEHFGGIEGVRKAFACNERIVAHKDMSEDERCPSNCPFLVQDKRDDSHCTFECVPADKCTELNPEAPIADEKRGICRAPRVDACREPMMNGKEECKVCKRAYILWQGMCWFKYLWVIYLIGGFVVALLVLVGLYVTDLATRPVTNEKGLEDGLNFRSRMKILKPAQDEDDKPQPYSLCTNLHHELVAGPGLTLHMNFQIMVILWSLSIGLVWVALGFLVDNNLFVIGTKKFGTPYHNCLIVQWGWDVQQKLMWTKVLFLIIVYFLSIFFSLYYSISQLRIYQRLDWENKTMSDFVGCISGLPSFFGKDKPEDDIKEIVEKATGKKVIGVSMAWNYKPVQDQIMWCVQDDLDRRDEEALASVRSVTRVQQQETERYQACLKDLDPTVICWNCGAEFVSEALFCHRCGASRPKEDHREQPPRLSTREEAENEDDGGDEASEVCEGEEKKEEKSTRGCCPCACNCRNPLTLHRPYLIEKETKFLSPGDPHPHLQEEEKVRELLEGINTTEEAFVVFETEEDRDAALKSVKGIGLEVRGQQCSLTYQECEPDTVQWHNFGHSSMAMKLFRIIKGFGGILLALLVWTVVFYLPYAFSIINFNYDNGAQPGAVYSMTFTVVVIAGNAIMYEVCARISDSVGFFYKDDREACYMMLYTIACLFNVVLDAVLTYFMARQITMSLGFRTVDGLKLSEVKTFQESFETYAMQRMLGQNVYEYLVSCIFLPFVLEPLITILFPLLAAEWIVGSHPEMTGMEAQEWFRAPTMELGRYADIMLNMLLAILIFYFPGGWTHWCFFGMAAAHCWIYILDHVRVLRSIESCCFSSNHVDWWAQMMFPAGCGTILAALVFKANCQGYGYCMTGLHITKTCTAAWIIHTGIHSLMVMYLVPIFGLSEERLESETPRQMDTYQETNRHQPKNWFNTNPVHCLRSAYIYKHPRPVVYCMVGREHLLEKNEELGCCYHAKAVDAETFKLGGMFWEAAREMNKTFASTVRRYSTPPAGQSPSNRSTSSSGSAPNRRFTM